MSASRTGDDASGVGKMGNPEAPENGEAIEREEDGGGVGGGSSGTIRPTGREPVRMPVVMDPALGEVLLFTKAQMAALLQVSVRCLSDMMRRGDVSYFKLNGKLVRFRARDVMERLNEVALVSRREERAPDAGKEDA